MSKGGMASKKERNKMAQSALAKKFMKQMKKKPKPKSESDKNLRLQ